MFWKEFIRLLGDLVAVSLTIDGQVLNPWFKFPVSSTFTRSYKRTSMSSNHLVMATSPDGPGKVINEWIRQCRKRRRGLQAKILARKFRRIRLILVMWYGTWYWPVYVLFEMWTCFRSAIAQRLPNGEGGFGQFTPGQRLGGTDRCRHPLDQR